MMYEMRRRKPNPSRLLTYGIFNVPHHISMVWEELAFNDDVSYTEQWKWIAAAQLNVIAMTGIHTPPVPRVTYPVI